MVFLYEYVWIDADGNLRGKTKVTNKDACGKAENLPVWNYDGSSTKQAEGRDSEVLIKPCSIFNDPFHNIESSSNVDGSFLVMCDTYLPDMSPHPTNTRYPAEESFKLFGDLEPRYGIEQEFFVKHRDLDGENKGRVLGFGESGTEELKPAPQGQYYCSVGASNAFGRDFIMKAFHNCLHAGLNLTGMNAEVAPGQWEFQVCADGIAAADQLYMMRYILGRTGEEFGYSVDFHPKPVHSVDWNGSGCHTNFSTKAMREEGGYEVIKVALERLSHYQELCMKNYGVDNDKRMTGELETSNFSEFSWGVANRGCSVRVPNDTVAEGKGYFEDRRPASNMDPYVVTAMLLELTSCEVKSENLKFVSSSEDSEEEEQPVEEEQVEEQSAPQFTDDLLPLPALDEEDKDSKVSYRSDGVVFDSVCTDGVCTDGVCTDGVCSTDYDPFNQTIRTKQQSEEFVKETTDSLELSESSEECVEECPPECADKCPAECPEECPKECVEESRNVSSPDVPFISLDSVPQQRPEIPILRVQEPESPLEQQVLPVEQPASPVEEPLPAPRQEKPESKSVFKTYTDYFNGLSKKD